MLVLLSPAKKLHPFPDRPYPTFSQPALLDQVELLMETTRPLSAERLGELMHISEALATLNHDRFQAFHTPFDLDNAVQAAHSFAGDTYVGLQAQSLDDQDLAWAQEHLAILSGLYGVLRPLDLMQPYRLEMGTRLENPRGKNLYAFWREHITPQLNAMTEGHADRTILNLASNEYFKAVVPKQLAGPVVTPVFKERKDGKERVISFMAKKARGTMANWFIRNRISDPAEIVHFSEAGYTFDPDGSKPGKPLFSRPQPPPVNPKKR